MMPQPGCKEFSAQFEQSQSNDMTRLIVVSNRLPVTIQHNSEGDYEFLQSSGGLVSGLSGVKKGTSFLWYGWPGMNVPQQDMKEVEEAVKEQCGAMPIWVDEKLAEKHYKDFSNSILWPMLHYHPGEVTFDEIAWNAYKEVNEIFASAVAKDIRDGDIVWIHDYHLMLMPKMLRALLGPFRSNVKIGFFLHTPFPSSEIYRILPVSAEILEGLLESDLLGFHTYDYSRHFLSSCSKVLELSTTPNGVEYHGKIVTVAAFPIGIDPGKFQDGLRKDKVQKRITELEAKFEGKKVIVGIDRLDYIKAVPQKLHGLECFLEEHPEYVGNLVLIQVGVPSRGDVEEYQHLCEVVHQTVGRINGKYGTADYMPVNFMHKSVDFDELLALYTISDIACVTSTRDGMNLVAFEYVATQGTRHGQLILSEFAGASQSLNGALLINPWSTKDLIDAFDEALNMSPEQRESNYKQLNAYVTKYTSSFWGEAFLVELKRISNDGQRKIKMRRNSAARSCTSLPSLNEHGSSNKPAIGVVGGHHGDAF